MCSASCLMVFNFCVKFHENMSSSFKVMERTRKLLTDTHMHTHIEKTKTIYPHGILCMQGYNYLKYSLLSTALINAAGALHYMKQEH